MEIRNDDKRPYSDSTHLILLLSRWKKPLLIVAGISLLLSFVFSSPFFIKPKYKSSVVFFPTTTNSISKALLGDGSDVLEFGSDEEAEQLLQILNSDEVKSAIVEKYHLMRHYGIDSLSEYPYAQLDDIYRNNISFERTEFMSVKIEVMDANPQTAADIANDIAALLDSAKTRMQQKRALEAFKIVEEEYNAKLHRIIVMEDSLKGLRDVGIFDYTQQTLILNEEYIKAGAAFHNASAQLEVYTKYKPETDTSVINAKARLKGAESRLKQMDKKLNQLASLGGTNVSLTESLWREREQLVSLRNRYEKAKVDVMRNLPHKFIVNNASKSERSCYPVRWLIIFISVVSTTLLTFILLTLTDRLSRQKAS